MKCSSRCHSSHATHNIADLLSSVNTLIEDLTDARAANSPADDISAQLQQLERFLSSGPLSKLKASERPRRKVRRLTQLGRRQQRRPAPAGKTSNDDIACSRSPCSNCNSSLGRSEQKLSNHRTYRSISLSSSDSDVRCRRTGSACYPANASNRGQSAHGTAGPIKQAFDNASNRRRRYMVARCQSVRRKRNSRWQQPQQQRRQQRRQSQPPLRQSEKPLQRPQQHKQQQRRQDQHSENGDVEFEAMDFEYLKGGLSQGENNTEKKEQQGCSDTVATMERMVADLQRRVEQLARQFQQQQQQRPPPPPICGQSERLKAEIRDIQRRIDQLRCWLRLAVGGGGGAGAAGRGDRVAGCRHVGWATERARDLLCDIKCKYERSLLSSRFDVNWPFMHIIAPVPPVWGEPECCEAED